MTRDLLRHRIETKLLRGRGGQEVGGYADRDRRPGAGAVRQGQGHDLRAARAPQGAPHPGQDQGARRSALRAAARPRTRASRSSPSSTRPTAARTTAATSASSTARASSSRSPTSRSRSTEGVVSKPIKTQFGWHLIEAEGPVLPASTRPLDAALKTQIRSQLVDKARQKHIANKFDPAVIELSRDIKFAPGYAPADRDHAVTDGAPAPLALIVALGPGEPELVPAAALEALRAAGSAAPHDLPDALRARARARSASRLDARCRDGLRARRRRLRARAQRSRLRRRCPSGRCSRARPPQAAAGALLELTAVLRRECPWDRAQTATSIVPHTVEEAYEVADAVREAGLSPKLIDELGDLLFQTTFLALLCEEAGASASWVDVALGVAAKLRLRHPWVFGARERRDGRATRATAGRTSRSRARAARASSTTCRARCRRCSRRASCSAARPRSGSSTPPSAAAFGDLESELAELRAELRGRPEPEPEREPLPRGRRRDRRRALRLRQRRAQAQLRSRARAARRDGPLPRARRARRAPRRRRGRRLPGGGDCRSRSTTIKRPSVLSGKSQ